MRVVLQRVQKSTVSIEGNVYSSIGQGLLILLGIENEDESQDIDWLCTKINSLRIFNDAEGKMNLSIHEVGGAYMVVSQFTLFASTKKGNRPSYIKAARPEIAIPLYNEFVNKLTIQSGLTVETGVFGADMKLELLNDGPVTVIIDSKNKE